MLADVTHTGRYVSHWKMYDTETKQLFGPAVWCTVEVVQSLRSEPVTTTEHSTGVTENSGVDVGLSTEDLFTFVKTLEMTAAKKPSPRPGPLAVPTNTPLGKPTSCFQGLKGRGQGLVIEDKDL